MLGFISTSRKLITTRNFSGNALIEIIIGDKGLRDRQFDYGYADITYLSQHCYEEEVLINPLNTFQIVECE